jgi:hypothetical protein
MSRFCFYTMAAGLGAALLSGCVPSHFRKRPDPVVVEQPAVPPGSPYHPQTDRSEKIDMPAEPPRLSAGFEKYGPRVDVVPLPPLPHPEPPQEPVGPPVPEPKVGPPEEPIVVALRAYREKRLPEALEALQHYDKPSQDLLLVVLPFLARLTEGGDRLSPREVSHVVEQLLLARVAGGGAEKAGPREAAELVEQLRALEASLRCRAALRVEKMAFCKKINGFGRIEPHSEGHAFEAGAGGRPGELVQVYVELANCSGKKNGPWHETWLAGRVEIRDPEGTVVWVENIPPRPDRSLSPRNDYFINYSFWVPPKLPPGRTYTLWVQVKDVTGLPPREGGVSPEALEVPAHRTAEASLVFKVSGPQTVRGLGPDAEPPPNAAPPAGGKSGG